MAAAVEKLDDRKYEGVGSFRAPIRVPGRYGKSHLASDQRTSRTVTWSLDALDDDPGYAKLDAMVGVVNDGLRACTAPEETLLNLDWHHDCYRISPHALAGKHRPGCPASMMPDGDYNIHVAEGFRYDTFGHPWENTICMFGTSLLDRVASRVDEIPLRKVREGGRSATQS